MKYETTSAILLAFLVPFLICGLLSDSSYDSMAQEPSATGNEMSELKKAVPVYTYDVINTFPHDRNAFTQGLVFQQGTFYESTGLNGASSLRLVDPLSGTVLKKVDVASQFFAEGMTIYNNKIYQLTWLSHKGFIYDLNSFEKIGEFSYDGEGWGLTNNEKFLIMSDGTNVIRFLDPDTLQTKKTISVFSNGQPLMRINELEFINGEIFANIWQTDMVVRINPRNGKILGWIDLSGLLSPEDRDGHVDVLNGIAYDQASERLFFTGKLWTKIFEIKLKKK